MDSEFLATSDYLSDRHNRHSRTGGRGVCFCYHDSGQTAFLSETLHEPVEYLTMPDVCCETGVIRRTPPMLSNR